MKKGGTYKLLGIRWVHGDPGGPVAKTPCSQCRGPRFDPGQGTRSHMLQLKDPACCNKDLVQPNK